MTGVLVPARVMEVRRARKRLNEMNDTIDRFVRIQNEAHESACAAEKAKLRYLGTLPWAIRRDLGYE